MNLPLTVSLGESTARVIEAGLLSGRWTQLPGERRLASELCVGRSTVRTALALLTNRGHLLPSKQGRRRQRGILEENARAPVRALNVGLLFETKLSANALAANGFLAELEHAIERQGHQVVRGLPDLTHQARRRGGLDALVSANRVDAWLVARGSWEHLQWLASQSQPVLAIGGRCIGLPIASVGFDHSAGLRVATRELLQMGHRRIVYICERFIRVAPQPGRLLCAFLEELATVGLHANNYNLPEWDETPDGLQRILEELFRFTPPTALIVSNAFAAAGVLCFCNQHGLRIPHDLSLVATRTSEDMAWFRPRLGVIVSDDQQLIAPILRWVTKIARGETPHRQVLLPSRFIRGESCARCAD